MRGSFGHSRANAIPRGPPREVAQTKMCGRHQQHFGTWPHAQEKEALVRAMAKELGELEQSKDGHIRAANQEVQ